MKHILQGAVVGWLLLTLQITTVSAQGTAFTYQGRLNANGSPANGSYDLAFTLYLTNATGSAVAGPVTNPAVAVTNGLFTTTVDFSNVFAGTNNWLELAVSTNGANAFNTLTPRQPILPVPYAIHAANAGSAATATTANSASSVTANSIGTAALQTGAITSGKIAGGQVVKAVNGLYDSVNLVAGANITVTPNAGNNTVTIAGSTASTLAWLDGGNAVPGLNPSLGPNNANSLDLILANPGFPTERVFHVEDPYQSLGFGPNIIGGYSGNNANGYYEATIGGGGGASNPNQVTAPGGTIGGGAGNSAGNYGFVGGGLQNQAAFYSVVAGGEFNTIASSVQGSTIGGGQNNSIQQEYGTVAGGFQNAILANGYYATIGGGAGNTNNASEGVVAGGSANQVVGTYTTVGGGYNNQATNYADTVAGGYGNTAGGADSTVSGGAGNTANAPGATVAGGGGNTASGANASVGGGGGNLSSGSCSAIPGGWLNLVAGSNSLAAGSHAQAVNPGAFVWADSQNSYTYFSSLTDNSFNVRAAGGARFVTSGAGMTIDGSPVLTTGSSALGLSLQQNASGAPNFLAGSPVNFVRLYIVGATVGGGGATNYAGTNYVNSVSADFGTVGGGADNSIGVSSPFSTVGGGVSNTATGTAATIAGGQGNQTGYNYASIGGGFQNQASGAYAVVAGGAANTIAFGNSYSGIGAGQSNSIAAVSCGTIAGGGQNTIKSASAYAVIGGGFNNTNNGNVGTVAGGAQNQAAGSYTTIGGGLQNQATNYADTVAGGNNNAANGGNSVVGGGAYNIASAAAGTVAGGSNNVAGGLFSFAAGANARATNDGAFVWADSQNSRFGSTTTNQFNVRANGGGRFVTSGAGVTVDGQNVLTGISPGNGGGLTNLNASALTSGTIPLAQIPAAVVTNNEAGVTLSGTLSGNGGGLTNLNASQLTSGTVPNAQLSGTYSGALTFNNGGNSFTGNVLTISASHIGGWPNSAVNFVNTSTTTNNAPALRVVNNGGTNYDGALSVSANIPGSGGNGLIAEFGNASAFVTVITNDGTVYAHGFVGSGSGLTSVNANTVGGGQLSAVAGQNGLSAGTNIFLNDHPVYLRNDHNHGLGYNGGGITNFPSVAVQPDGPVLWGYSGGALGVLNGGAQAALTWNNVSVNVSNALNVTGNLTANNTPGVNWNQVSSTGILPLNTNVIVAICTNAAPAAGYYVVTATGNINNLFTGSANYATVTLAQVYSGNTILGLANTSLSPGNNSGFSLSWVVPVNFPGTPQVFAVEVNINALGPNAYASGVNLTAMYFPRQNN